MRVTSTKEGITTPRVYPLVETMCDDVGLRMDNQATTRRTFYSVVINGLMGLITAAIAAPAAAYLFLKPKSEKKSQWVDAAELSALKIGKPEEVVYRRTRVDGWRVLNEKTTAWVVRTDDQHVVAFAPGCTHLACAYHWEGGQNQFVCPCHASTFSIAMARSRADPPRGRWIAM
jgi:menaquinol-cytochrome c reductase iron-sulfur subunit